MNDTPQFCKQIGIKQNHKRSTALLRLLKYAQQAQDPILEQATRTVTHATSGGFTSRIARAWAKRMTAFEVVSLCRTVARHSPGSHPEQIQTALDAIVAAVEQRLQKEAVS